MKKKIRMSDFLVILSFFLAAIYHTASVWLKPAGGKPKKLLSKKIREEFSQLKLMLKLRYYGIIGPDYGAFGPPLDYLKRK